MALLEVKDLSVFYGKACSLSNVSLSVEKGEVVGIIGPNGAGKSTLLDSIIGLTDWNGQIVFNGNDLRQLSPVETIRKGIGYAPEARNLFSYMAVKDNLLVGAYRAKDSKDKNLRMVFELFPVLEKRQNQEAKTLSGGEQQMLSLGRALMTNPKLLLVDEPTIGLAPLVCSEIANVLQELKQNRGMTIVITEQNVNFALTLAEEIYLLETGHMKMKGKPEELKQESYIQETYFGS
ncbi:MAG: ABC transporter ATP-binding protein [Deltaproteobacteria bacterium]|jgi:branched-chain amino acid transport system ATP-binding protein|nr:ABC transporter ATP-binding protein [Deltaproteobacteria bacterium]